MANLLDFERLMALEPGAVATWAFLTLIIVGGLLLGKKIRAMNADRAKRVKEFASGLGLAPMPGSKMTNSFMHFEGARNGRKVGLGICAEMAGRKQRNPKMFAYAYCDPRGFEMKMERRMFKIGANEVESGDGEVDRQMSSKANDPVKAKGTLGLDNIARIKEIWKREKNLNSISPPGIFSIFIGRNKMKESGGGLMSTVAGALAGKPRTTPMERIPSGQGVVFIEKGLPGFGIGLDKQMLSLFLELAVSLAEKAER